MPRYGIFFDCFCGAADVISPVARYPLESQIQLPNSPTGSLMMEIARPGPCGQVLAAWWACLGNTDVGADHCAFWTVMTRALMPLLPWRFDVGQLVVVDDERGTGYLQL